MAVNLFSRMKQEFNHLRFRLRYSAPLPVDLSKITDFRGERFPAIEDDCWLDKPDAQQRVASKLEASEIDAEQASACAFWIKNGYLVIPALIPPNLLDTTWSDYEEALASGVLGPLSFVNNQKTLIDRKLDPHLHVPAIRALQHHGAVLRWTDLLLGRKTVPFQTIMGHAGSQQAAHSDSIHMTTYPLGYLIANWIAFEDIKPDSGALEYYPGSHRLPYALSKEVGIELNEFKEKGHAVYHERYEPFIGNACEKAGLKKETFYAKKGDTLFWHANLVHGGGLRIDPDVSRKALVCHYFAEGVVTYHDLSGNATRLHKAGLYKELQS